MNTPICDFVRRYVQSNSLRLHMPGHKGQGPLGMEACDITEIEGADSLYEANGIIRESEANASQLFGSGTLYSTEGSSQCIRAMLYLACLYTKQKGERPIIWAGRNAHKTFLSAAALLDFDVVWLCPEHQESYLSCNINADMLEKLLNEATVKPGAIYLTSPDYLGNMLDLQGISGVCHRHGVLLVVDNAHGAYLKFLPQSMHPMDLGADLCCDSAHKTLPVLTGGAYLHISSKLPAMFAAQAKQALALFGSTSPSYLILQSLDAANRYLSEGYREKLKNFLPQVEKTKDSLRRMGYCLAESEPLKLTLSVKGYGYTGVEFAAKLKDNDIVCEFADPDFLVLMLTPEVGARGLARIEDVLSSIPRRRAVPDAPPAFNLPERVMSVRDALFSESESIPVSASTGRVLAAASVGCPPAVPIVVSGERIDEAAIRCFEYYGINTCSVVNKAP